MNSRPRVFVVNEPLKMEGGEWVRVLNLRPARDHGELVFLLPAGQLPEDPAPTLKMLKRGLADFTKEDYLLLVGDPRAIAWAGAMAAKNTGGELKLLHWQRDHRRYDPVCANIFLAEETV